MDAAFDSDIKKASQPFSLGPRGCIGRNVAYMEIRLILGYLFWNFDVELADDAPMWDPSDEMKHMRAFNTWDKPPLLVRVVPLKR
jgi:cytochrome P450